jgi:kynureninase
VVCSANEFPSVLHSVQRWQDLLRLDLRVVEPGPDGFVDQAAVLDALSGDEGAEVGLVALSHVGFTTGERLPDAFLQEVAARARDADALFVLDGYHANATMPIDVEALGADVYLGGLLKEASGSAGNGFVYLREGLELTPRTTGWFGDADPFGFKRAPTPHETVRRRFLGGTTPVAALYHAVEGVRLLLEAGLEAVRDHSLALTARALERADDAGLALRSPRAPERRGAMVIVEVDAADRLCAYLKHEHVYTDSRQGRYLRLAPWVWNTRADVDRAFDAIEEALQGETYRRTDLEDVLGPVT